MFLAIDYGRKRIGLAVGQMIPKGADTIDASDTAEAILAIAKLCVDQEIEKIIIGLPLRSQGEKGTTAAEIEEFAAGLREVTKLEIAFEPEEFTSVEAAELIKQSGKSFSRASGKTDELAAMLILDRYLESNPIQEDD